jgi:hypothetical protein
MVLPPNAPVDPYYNVNYLKKLTLAQLQTLYNSLVGTVTVSARAADTLPSTSVTLTISDSSRYANGYRIIGYQLKMVGDAIVIAVPGPDSITIQYQEQIFPAIQAGTELYFVPNYTAYQFISYQWLLAQLTGQSLACSQIESEFAFPGLFKLSDYLGLSAQISLKPIAWSQFYGITNDYYPYEVDPYNNPISTNQTLAQFIGGPTSSLTLVQSGWIKGNTIPTAQQSSYTNCVGTAMIDTVELHIGGQLIETITGEYIQNYMDMTTELQNKPALTILYGKDDYSALYTARTYIINLPFYFYRETGLAIPLVALYRQDVEFLVRFNNFGSNYTVGADFSQFTMTPNPGNSIQIGSIAKQFNYTTLTLPSGTYTGPIKDGMELLIDLSAYGVDANAIAVIDSTHPITIDSVEYSKQSDYIPLLSTADSLQLWVRFTPVTVSYQGGSYDKQLLFVFPLVQPGNIQTYVPRLDSQFLPFMDVTVIGEFAFLTGPELNFFRERKLTYLVSQLQISKNRLPKGSVGGYFQLNFINPVTQLQVFIRNDRNIDANRVYLNRNVDLFDYSQNGLINMGLTFNGQEAFSAGAIDATYLGALEVLDKRTAPAYKDGIVTSNIFMYAFCMKPEAISNPSGHVNFSRIRQQILEVNMTPDLFYEKQVNIYATNYNVLRVQHGLAGLLFNSSM